MPYYVIDVPLNGIIPTSSYNHSDIALLNKTTNRFIYYFSQVTVPYAYIGIADINNPLSSSSTITYHRQIVVPPLQYQFYTIERISNDRFILLRVYNNKFYGQVFDVSSNEFTPISNETYLHDNVYITDLPQAKRSFKIIPISPNQFLFAVLQNNRRTYRVYHATYTDGGNITFSQIYNNTASLNLLSIRWYKNASTSDVFVIPFRTDGKIYDVHRITSSFTHFFASVPVDTTNVFLTSSGKYIALNRYDRAKWYISTDATNWSQVNQTYSSHSFRGRHIHSMCRTIS